MPLRELLRPTSSQPPVVMLSASDGSVLACFACGVATQRSADVFTYRTFPDRGRALLNKPVEVEVDVCPDCAARHSSLDPRAARAADALAAAGITASPRDVLATALVELGQTMRWYSSASLAPGRCASSPWAHVSDEQREQVRAAYATVLRARALRGRTTRVPPPGPTREVPDPLPGCLFCGVDHVEVPQARVEARGGVEAMASDPDVWRPLRTTRGALAGRAVARAAERVEGYLCPACEEARRQVGSIGPTALERSLLTHEDLGWSPNATVPGLRAWAVLPDDERWPSTQRWAHAPRTA